MTTLDLKAAPPPFLPARYLATAPWWGVAAGLLIIGLGPLPWMSRWHPGLLGLVHFAVLGVLGNACIGALLQFLAAAAGSPVAGSMRLWQGVHLGYNLGVALLVGGMLTGTVHLLWLGACLVSMMLCLLAWHLLRALVVGSGPVLLRASLALPIMAWALTGLLGAALVAGMTGLARVDIVATTDAHAVLGLLGMFGLMLLAVGRIVLPMFLGLPSPGLRAFVAGFTAFAAGVAAAVVWRLLADQPTGPARLAALMACTASVAGLLALGQRRCGRNRPLAAAWGLGLSVVLSSGLAVLLDPWRGGLAAVTALVAVALPLLVLSMMLEISAFLAWIDLHRRCGRGVHLPGVHLLLPDRLKWCWLGVHALAGTLLLTLAIWPRPALALAAGAACSAAYAALALAGHQPRRRARRFLRNHEAPR